MKAKYKTLWTATANEELANIYSYIYYIFCNSNAVERLSKKIEKSMLTIEEFPEIYPRIYSKRNNELRKMVIGNYIIIYKVDYSNKQIYILHIFNARQNYFNQI